ncbi:MAG: mevalonate kinase [Deltaproteobacteria bacterium]|nr:mevalonate kinase [Deltaproteobacteria bacterium]
MTASASIGYAPGKIILLGEHSVVYGQPALAASIDRGMRVVISKLPDDAVDGPELRGSGFGIQAKARPDPTGEGPDALRKALARLIELFGESVKRLSIVVEGAIPAGSGLGSSAALSVALIRGVHRHFDQDLSDATLLHSATQLEKVFHGSPSGVDHSAIIHGGLIHYFRAESQEVGDVQTVIPGRRLRLAIGIAGHHAGTSHAVGALSDRRKRHPDAFGRIFDSIGLLVQEATEAAREGHLAAVGELMNLNQGYLNALGVSTPTIETLCDIARSKGALGAKLTGAGGGGAIIALVDEDPTPIVRAFAEAGYESFATEIATRAKPLDGGAL